MGYKIFVQPMKVFAKCYISPIREVFHPRKFPAVHAMSVIGFISATFNLHSPPHTPSELLYTRQTVIISHSPLAHLPVIAGLGAELLVRHSAEEWLPQVHHSAGEKQVPSALLLLVVVVVVVVVVVAPCRLLLSAGDKQHKPPFTFTFASNTNNDRRCKSIVCCCLWLHTHMHTSLYICIITELTKVIQ